FFINADIDRADDWEGDLASNWDEHDYVVASTVVKRQEARRSENRPSGAKKRTASKGKAPAPRRRKEGTKVKRHVSDPERATAEKADAQNMENGVQGQEARAHRPENIFATQL
ncbi:MAG: hypothetical protein IJH25_01250, partial [Clostridia bacterium]|nr:hypothetical protein [Clostridia bacterium]